MPTKYKSKIQVRFRDLDLNGHVNNSVYMDYILFARIDQMQKDYHYSMEQFLEQGMSWVARTLHVDYLRPIKMGDEVYAYTWTISADKRIFRVGVELTKVVNGEREKACLTGYIDYALIDIHTGRSISIPQEIIDVFKPKDGDE